MNNEVMMQATHDFHGHLGTLFSAQSDMDFNEHGMYEDWKDQRLPEDLEREVRIMAVEMQRIRESSHLTREPPDSICLNLKEEISLTESRLRELSASLERLLRVNQNIKSKLADERAFFETLAEFSELPQQAKDIICRSYFEQTLIDFKRRLREYRDHVEDIHSMYSSNSSKPRTVGGIIEILEKHQDSLKAAAAKVYVLHEKTEQLAQNFESLLLGQHHRVRFTTQNDFSESAQYFMDDLPPLEPPQRSFSACVERSQSDLASITDSIFCAKSSSFSRFNIQDNRMQ